MCRPTVLCLTMCGAPHPYRSQILRLWHSTTARHATLRRSPPLGLYVMHGGSRHVSSRSVLYITNSVVIPLLHSSDILCSGFIKLQVFRALYYFLCVIKNRLGYASVHTIYTWINLQCRSCLFSDHVTSTTLHHKCIFSATNTHSKHVEINSVYLS